MFKVIGFVSVVATLFWVWYSLLGGTPLLMAKYDTPNDSRLVRGFLHVHYRFLMLIAAVGAVSFIVTQNTLLAGVMLSEVALAALALFLIVAKMDRLRSPTRPLDQPAARSYRRLLTGALALNLINLVIVVGFISQSSLVTCVKTPPGCDPAQNVAGQPPSCVDRCSIF